MKLNTVEFFQILTELEKESHFSSSSVCKGK
jgi:hypothetical protein